MRESFASNMRRKYWFAKAKSLRPQVKQIKDHIPAGYFLKRSKIMKCRGTSQTCRKCSDMGDFLSRTWQLIWQFHVDTFFVRRISGPLSFRPTFTFQIPKWEDTLKELARVLSSHSLKTKWDKEKESNFVTGIENCLILLVSVASFVPSRNKRERWSNLKGKIVTGTSLKHVKQKATRNTPAKLCISIAHIFAKHFFFVKNNKFTRQNAKFSELVAMVCKYPYPTSKADYMLYFGRLEL